MSSSTRRRTTGGMRAAAGAAALAVLAVLAAAPGAAATRSYCFDDSLVAMYPLDKGFGDRAFDVSRAGGAAKVDLYLDGEGAAEWIEDPEAGRGVRFTGGALLSAGPALKLSDRLSASGALTVEAWLRANETAPGGAAAARVLSLTGGNACPDLQSVVVGQTRDRDGHALLDYRLRAESTPSCAEVWHQYPVLPLDELVHVAVTYDGASKRVYINGTLSGITAVPGGGGALDFNRDFRLALGNDVGGDRAWRGDLFKVAVWDRALGPCEVAQLVGLGTSGHTGDVCVPDEDAEAEAAGAAAGRAPSAQTAPTQPRRGVESCDSSTSQQYCADDDLVALYTFDEEQGGAVVHDRATVGVPLDLYVGDVNNVHRASGQGLRVLRSGADIASRGPAAKLTAAIKATQAFTFELWLKAWDKGEGADHGTRVLSLGGEESCPDASLFLGLSPGNRFDYRLKTSGAQNDCGADGREYPLLGQGELTHVVVTWSQAEALKRVYVDGTLSYLVPAAGDTLSDWDASRPLRLGDAAVEYQKLAVWQRAMSECEVRALHGLGHRAAAFCEEPLACADEPPRARCFADSLLAYYPLDEAEGVTLHDRSGGGEHLRLADPSSVSWQRPNGVRFARRNALAESYLPAAGVRDAWRASGALSVEMWVRAKESSIADPPGEEATILQAGGLVVGQAAGGHLDFGGERYAWALRPADTLTHLVATYDGEFLALYVNGVLHGVRETNGTDAPPLDGWLGDGDGADFFLRLGNSPLLDRDWKGTLHSVSLYDRALARCEAVALHALGRDSSVECPETMPPCAVTLPDFCFAKDLVAYYPLDEPAGSDTAHDLSGVGLPLDLAVRGPVEWSPGGTANGLLFAGEGAAAESTAGTQALAAQLRDTNAVTFSAWVTVPAGAAGGALLHAGTGEGAGGCGNTSFALRHGGDDGSVSVTAATSELPACGNGTVSLAQLVPADGAEHHLVVMFIGCELRVYVDGAPVGSLPHPGDLAWAPGARLRLGNDDSLGATLLGATLRSVALWRRSLTASEVAQVHELGSGPGVSCGCNGASLLDDGAFLVRTPGANRGGEFSSAFQSGQVNIYNSGVPRKYMEFNLTSGPCEGRDTSVSCFGFQAISAEVWSRQIFQYGDVIWTSRAEARSGAVSSVFTFHGTSTDNGPVYSIIMSWAGLERNKIVCNIKTWDAVLGIYDNYEYIDVGFDWSASEHEYRIRWRPHYVEWYADGVLLRRVDEDLLNRPFGELGHVPYLGGRVMAHSWSVDSGLFIQGFRDFTGPYDPSDLLPHYFWIFCPRVEQLVGECCLADGDCPEPEAPAANGAFVIAPSGEAEAGAEEVVLACEVGSPTGDGQVPCLNDTQCLPPPPPPSLVPEESGVELVDGVEMVRLTFVASLQYTSVSFQFVDGESECATTSRPTVWSAYLSGDKPCVTSYVALMPYDDLERCGFVREDIEEVRSNFTRFVAAVVATTTEPVSVDVDDSMRVTRQTAITAIVSHARGVDVTPGEVEVYSDTVYLSFATVTAQIFRPGTDTAYVRLVTAAVWPHFLTARSITTDDSFGVSIAEVGDPCEPTLDDFCVQEWHIEVAPETGVCDLNALYNVDFLVGCFGPPAFTGECASVDNVTSSLVQFRTASEEYCAIVVAEGDVSAAIGAFSDPVYTVAETNFILSQRAYFSAFVEGDAGVEVESVTLLSVMVRSASDAVLYDMGAATALGRDSIFTVEGGGGAQESRFSFVFTSLNIAGYEASGTLQVGAVVADLEVRYAVRSPLLGLAAGAAAGAAAPAQRVRRLSVLLRPSDSPPLSAAAKRGVETLAGTSDIFLSSSSLPSVSVLVRRSLTADSASVFGLDKEAATAAVAAFVVTVLALVVVAGLRRHKRETQRRAEREQRREANRKRKLAARAAATGRRVDELSVSSVRNHELGIVHENSFSGSSLK